MHTGSRRRAIPLALAASAALLCGCQEDGPSNNALGQWTVEGVFRGKVTMMETVSGQSWVFEANGDPQPAIVPIDLQPDEMGLGFWFQVDSPDAIDCESSTSSVLDPDTGRAWIRARTSCGFPFAELDIPDPGLAACLSDRMSMGYPAPLTSQQITSLYCPGRGIRNLYGLDVFYRLNHLDLSDNSLESLDSLDLSRLSRLELLTLSDNEFEEVELAPVVGRFFGRLDLSKNRIERLTGLHGVVLETLDLDDNLLERFEVTPSPGSASSASAEEASPGAPTSIEELLISDNRLVHLDLSGLDTGPRLLRARNNQLEVLNLDFGEEWADTLLTVDLTNNRLSDAATPVDPATPSLALPSRGIEYLQLWGNRFEEVPDEYLVPGLIYLDVGHNLITSIDPSPAVDLNVLRIDGNALTEFTMADAPLLESLHASDNAIEFFDWRRGENALTYLDLSGNPLASLSACDAPELDSLELDDVGLTTIDLSRCPKLRFASLEGNLLSTIDVSSNPRLDYLYMQDNPLACDAIDAVRSAHPLLGPSFTTGPDPCIP